MKINIVEARSLLVEIGEILKIGAPFQLKFRLETKFIPELLKAEKLSAEEIHLLALANGAKGGISDWKFEKKDGKVVNKKGYEKFNKEVEAFLFSNEIEIEHTLKLNLFDGLTIVNHCPVICKFIEE